MSDSRAHDFYATSMDLLVEAKIPFLVGGAAALRMYTGIVRDTKDFDLMLLPRDVERAVKVFRAAGYRAEIAFSHWLGKVHQGEMFIDIIFNSGNGVCPVDEEWLENARPAEIFGRKVLLCPPEEMVWQKCYIMERERFDGADVQHLLLRCGKNMDWGRLVRRFDQDWRVLFTHLVLFPFVYPSVTGIIPSCLMDHLTERLRDEESQTGERGLCNGPLISRAQYLADVERWGFGDPRAGARGAMTREQVEAWTNAIEREVVRH